MLQYKLSTYTGLKDRIKQKNSKQCTDFLGRVAVNTFVKKKEVCLLMVIMKNIKI